MSSTYLKNGQRSRCTGCAACAQVCGRSAIRMEYDDEQFAYPVINKEKCTNCGMCVKVCPVEKDMLHRSADTVFGGYINDREVLEKSTSGGAFTAIVKAWCSSGDFAVFGGAQAKDLSTEHRCITDLSDLDQLRKSKYSQSRIGSSYIECRKMLEEGRYVVFSGTPCQIAGLRSFLGDKDYPRLLTVDVICEGVPSPKFYEKLVEHMQKRKKSHAVSLDYRDKDGDRWDFNVMSITFENGKKFKIDRWVNPFFDIWIDHLMSRPSCYECRYTNRRRCSDITLGDLWGVHKICPEVYNDNRGASMVICNTEKGRSAFSDAQQMMFTKEIPIEEAVRFSSRMRVPIPMNERREDFMKDLDVMDYPELVQKWAKRPSIKLLISKYVIGTNRQVVRKYMRKKQRETAPDRHNIKQG